MNENIGTATSSAPVEPVVVAAEAPPKKQTKRDRNVDLLHQAADLGIYKVGDKISTLPGENMEKIKAYCESKGVELSDQQVWNADYDLRTRLGMALKGPSPTPSKKKRKRRGKKQSGKTAAPPIYKIVEEAAAQGLTDLSAGTPSAERRKISGFSRQKYGIGLDARQIAKAKAYVRNGYTTRPGEKSGRPQGSARVAKVHQTPPPHHVIVKEAAAKGCINLVVVETSKQEQDAVIQFAADKYGVEMNGRQVIRAKFFARNGYKKIGTDISPADSASPKEAVSIPLYQIVRKAAGQNLIDLVPKRTSEKERKAVVRFAREQFGVKMTEDQVGWGKSHIKRRGLGPDISNGQESAAAAEATTAGVDVQLQAIFEECAQKVSALIKQKLAGVEAEVNARVTAKMEAVMAQLRQS